MPITVGCSSCQAKLKVADTLAGKAVKCPKCASIIRVPESGGPAANAAPPRKSTAPIRAPTGADSSAKAAPALKPKPKPPNAEAEKLDELDELDEIDDEEAPEVEAVAEDERPRKRSLVKDVSGRDLSVERDVPEQLQALVAAELSEGERLVWVGQPNKTLVMVRGLGGTAVGVAMFLMFLGMLFGVATGLMKGGTGWRGWPLVLLLQTPFYVMSLYIILTPVRWGWQATRTCFALTNRRALVWSCAWYGALRVHSSSPGDLAFMRRAESWIYGRGTGDLIFRAANSSAQTTAHGFWALDDVRDIEQLIRDTLIDA